MHPSAESMRPCASAEVATKQTTMSGTRSTRIMRRGAQKFWQNSKIKSRGMPGARPNRPTKWPR
eukprot:3264429-Alexandrium_andersonii.AAC.1